MTYSSFLSNPVYINIVILVLLVFLVLFLWRKIIVLEGNYFIIEKRVNLIKKDTREMSAKRKFENSNIVMTEIFDDIVDTDTCKNMGKCSFPLTSNCEIPISTSNICETDTPFEFNIQYNTDEIHITDTEDDTQISFDTEKISSNDEIKIVDKDNETNSTTSEFTFNTDKYNLKKLSKLNVDKLKDLCLSHNLSVDGTKSQLVNRILETN